MVSVVAREFVYTTSVNKLYSHGLAIVEKWQSLAASLFSHLLLMRVLLTTSLAAEPVQCPNSCGADNLQLQEDMSSHCPLSYVKCELFTQAVMPRCTGKIIPLIRLTTCHYYPRRTGNSSSMQIRKQSDELDEMEANVVFSVTSSPSSWLNSKVPGYLNHSALVATSCKSMLHLNGSLVNHDGHDYDCQRWGGVA